MKCGPRGEWTWEKGGAKGVRPKGADQHGLGQTSGAESALIDILRIPVSVLTTKKDESPEKGARTRA
jgi:hypothetical protein